MTPDSTMITAPITMKTYVGQLNIAAAGDRDVCPDLDVFAAGVLATLDALAPTVG